MPRAPCAQVEGVSKKRRGIGGGGGAAGSQASTSRRDRGLAVDFKESQVRGASVFLCWLTCCTVHAREMSTPVVTDRMRSFFIKMMV